MRRLYEELMAIPLILRLTILASFGTGAALLVTTLFKVGTFQIYDETLTGDQLWSEGYGPFFVIAGVILMSAGFGTFKGRGWSQWLVVFLSVAMSPIPLIYSRHQFHAGGSSGMDLRCSRIRLGGVLLLVSLSQAERTLCLGCMALIVPTEYPLPSTWPCPDGYP
jgi:hypothetical protein